MKCTTVLLIYNEEENITPQTEAVLATYDANDIDGEILLVDDGSVDSSPGICDELAAKHDRVRVIHHNPNKGRSYAIQTGFDNARGEITVYMDGDQQYEPKSIPQFLDKIDEGFDAVTGYRTNRADVFYRKWQSQLYNRIIIQGLCGLRIRDQNSGFKAFRTEAARRMDFNPDGYKGLHRFIMPLAFIRGLTIAEIPIVHYDRPSGKSYINVSTVAFVMLGDYFRFSREHRTEIKAAKLRVKASQ
jgi:glycosyltransferase involved in cell wall biosynthesis